LAWAVAAGGAEGLYFVALAAALARAPYGAVYAASRGGALLLVWPAAALIFGEAVTVRGTCGAAMVLAGVLMVASAGRLAGGAAGLAFAGLCAVGIAGYHLFYGRALAHGAGEAPVFAVALSIALPAAWATSRLRGGTVEPGPRGWLRWSVAGVVCAASFLIFLLGLAGSGAGPALTIRNTSIIFAQAIAAAMGERPPPRQLAGAALIALGAAMVA
jgi:drug/metabolite transporter (DMT)-like permease